MLTFKARPITGNLLALSCQTARMFQIVRLCHIVTTACLGLAGVTKRTLFCHFLQLSQKTTEANLVLF